MQRVLLRPQDPDLVIWSSLGGDHLEMSIKGKDCITFHDLCLCVLLFWEINSLILSMLLSKSLFVMDKLSLTFLYNQNNTDSRRSLIICIIQNIFVGRMFLWMRRFTDLKEFCWKTKLYGTVRRFMECETRLINSSSSSCTFWADLFSTIMVFIFHKSYIS